MASSLRPHWERVLEQQILVVTVQTALSLAAPAVASVVLVSLYPCSVGV